MFRQAARSHPQRPSVRRTWRGVVCGAVATAAVLSCATSVSAAPKPPPNPTNAQLSAAALAKAELADTVGRLSAQIVQATSQLQALSAATELAEQKFAYAQSLLSDAKEQAAQAQADVVSAQKAITTARSNLTGYVRNTYMSPAAGSTTVGLLTATDPTALLQGGDYQQYVTAHNLNAMGALDRATVAKSNADAKAKSLVNRQTQLAAAAAEAQRGAQLAYAQQQAQTAHLQASQAAYRTALNTAQLKLATLNNQRATFIAYQQEQARIAAEKARQLALARARAAAAAAAELARLHAQELAAQRAAARNSNSSSSSSSSSSQSTYSVPLPAAGSMGGWTAAKGVAAAQRALSELGVRYSWAAGGYNGPTYGVNSPGTDGYADSSVFGFDCSGLAMYAWAPQGKYLPHYALAQYSVAGSFHPSSSEFLPGDLLFWSNGGEDAIHHVAIYIGNGNVVQAPNSGDVVKVTPWNQVDSGYFGATRPLT